MLARISERIVNRQITKGILQDGERAVYQYAYELLLNQVINIFLAVLIAVAFGAPLPVLLFLVSYIPLRSFCGGYHADTNFGCTVVSAILICCVCWIYQNSGNVFFFAYYPFIYLISGYLVIRYAPVPDKNKPLDEAETVRYRQKSRVIWLWEAVIGVILYLLHNQYGIVLAVSHLFLSVMLAAGKVKNR
ncbi:MAG: accessory gene regulator B family protein [Eubacterium sp.]|nr:accessory gene regulator B family protein [Eubacterium sp.]